MGSKGMYIGRRVDPSSMEVSSEDTLLDPDRLTRHAVCLGMTGSGKTGLCVSLLEELSMAGIPALVIDPKGDMANLALGFQEHRPEDFRPWIDPATARRDGQSVEAYAEKISGLWQKGLAKWGVDAERIARFVRGARVTVYTPGSDAGVPVNVLSALAAPPAELLEDQEGMRDLVGGTVGSLLGLVGVDADPVTDPAHIVLSRILSDAWAAGQNADLELLITRLVDPPFEKVGVFPVDTFYPRKDRMKLAMQLNGVIASPAFGAWRQGAALDVDGFLAKRDGRTQISVFYIAHLDDSQRMFFISTLLNRVLAWSRRQPGTSTLRALMYFDEVFGYLPPHPRNPPSKRSVLMLMKQARAVGLGTMLVTQNPVDIDYKALSNAGTWLIGRLQTKQDRERVLDGLVSASGAFDRGMVSDWLEGLPSRTFVLRDVKAREPALVHSRWAISYLRGPLTRREVQQLPEEYRSYEAAAAPAAPSVVAAATAAAPRPVKDDLPDHGPQPPPAPGSYTHHFLDPRVVFSSRLAGHFEEASIPKRDDGKLVWKPAVHATLHLRFDEGDFVHDREEQRLFFPVTDREIGERGDPALEPGDFLPAAPADSLFAPLPALIDEASELKRLEKRVVEDIYRGETQKMFRHREFKLTSNAGETRDQFDERVRDAVQERVDVEVAKLKDKVDVKVKRLEDKKERLERDVLKWQQEARARGASELVSAGETLFGMFFGGRKKSLSTAMSKRQQTMRAKERLSRADEEAQELEREVYELENDTEHQIRVIENRLRGKERDVEEVDIRLERNDIRLDDFNILWVPVSRLF
ncbi:MAG: DUF853 family protein [Deltaproteobacteria bacterium]|nr:DUF853 family protein [Deltaproteobacteria bacterium]